MTGAADVQCARSRFSRPHFFEFFNAIGGKRTLQAPVRAYDWANRIIW
jgi:hypothetical protein